MECNRFQLEYEHKENLVWIFKVAFFNATNDQCYTSKFIYFERINYDDTLPSL
jgi:hypothetical protein